MKKRLVGFYVFLFLALFTQTVFARQIVLASEDRIGSFLQGVWLLTYHETSISWKGLKFYPRESKAEVIYEDIVECYVMGGKGCLEYHMCGSDVIKFICLDPFMPFPEVLKAKILKLNKKVLILDAEGIDVFIKEKVRPGKLPNELKRWWYGVKKEREEKVEVKLYFHDNKVEVFGKVAEIPFFRKIGVFPLKFFEVGIPSVIEVIIPFSGIESGFEEEARIIKSYLLVYPEKLVERGGMIYFPLK